MQSTRTEIENLFSQVNNGKLVLSQEAIFDSFKELFVRGICEMPPQNFDAANKELILNFKIKGLELKNKAYLNAFTLIFSKLQLQLPEDLHAMVKEQ